MRSTLICTLLISAWCANTTIAAEPAREVVRRSDLEFQPLNPARGDAAPKAGVLWGDLTKNVPTGALIQFADGFSSPPHIHNITYRAVVISGEVHNDDPQASEFWMGPGSFWIQAAGEPHITAAAKGGTATAFLEILAGPYLVRPADQAFDNGERSLNVDATNIVWLNSSDTTWIKQPLTHTTMAGPQISFLWRSLHNNESVGAFLKLPAGTKGDLQGSGPWLRAVTTQGQTRHTDPDDAETADLGPGSYFGSEGGASHSIQCIKSQECLLYLRTDGRFEFVSH